MITVILAEPEHPGNIGAVCRVMANFNLHDLVLIEPRCDPKAQEAKNFAKHAQTILMNARVTSWDVLDEYAVVGATAGVPTTDYNLLRSPLSPEEGAAKLVAVKPRSGSKGAAILFGRESTGLRNDELAKADFVITIPTHYKYPSMNLSHSVAVMLYAIYTQRPVERFAPMPAVEKKHLFAQFNAVIDALPFRIASMRATQKLLWKNVLGRAMLTKREANAAFGFLRAIEERAQRRTPSPTRATPRQRAKAR